MSEERGRRKTRVGRVVSDKMDKTVVVAIEKKVMHPIYKKFVRHRVKYKVHDEHNECRVGDEVLIEETRPLSKDKRWRLKQTLKKAVVV
jgi:small subunit ribosomal protein S17